MKEVEKLIVIAIPSDNILSYNFRRSLVIPCRYAEERLIDDIDMDEAIECATAPYISVGIDLSLYSIMEPVILN